MKSFFINKNYFLKNKFLFLRKFVKNLKDNNLK